MNGWQLVGEVGKNKQKVTNAACDLILENKKATGLERLWPYLLK